MTSRVIANLSLIWDSEPAGGQRRFECQSREFWSPGPRARPVRQRRWGCSERVTLFAPSSVNPMRAERLRQAGAEITIGSLEDFRDLTRVMKNIDRAYFCPPLEPGTLRRATLFAAAAREAKLEAVVQLSQWVADASIQRRTPVKSG